MKNVLLFADPGVDDAFAIMYAVLHPDINLIGIVAGYGNVEVETATRNIETILHLLDADIPVFGGANQPASDVYVEFYPEIHGIEGLGDYEPEGLGYQLTNFTDVYQLFDQYEDITIVEVGRNTGLMVGYMLGKQKMEQATDCFLMGGAFLTPGNITPAAEANFYGDPVAAKFVFENIYSHVFPLDVTEKALVTPEMIQYITAYTPLTRIREPIQLMYRFYQNVYQQFIPGLHGALIHDLMPLMYVTNPDMFRFVHREVYIETSTGPGRGASIADFRPSYETMKEEAADAIKHMIALEADYKAFFHQFLNTFVLSE
ncbi:purine nucleosidase [Alteribacillus persepolensis]|uniref:Purine nucleosidase n=1 Tax=Alteribacillus persepolensis TaxID=568899 RepID=A0A1G8K2V7_9BACI|nr:nucleoside hydrolase [Alteribacillus persepolensis]SDI37762.1 purine nucleosidase [Alteribacillus persepolensis]